MTDEMLIDTLVDNYSSQYRIYSALLDSIRAGQMKLNSAEIAGVIPILEARNRDFDTIKNMTVQINDARLEWEKRGASIHTLNAETLRTLLGNIRAILSEVLEENKRLETSLSILIGKK
ncbi:MAG: hypothetical protein JNL74_20750 [Fibrobacteres bacterium]|nr:hypothetical protein [Fibrobacterota bacterium]